MSSADAKLRAWWAYKQGLDGRLTGQTAAEVLAQTGWQRSVAGASPYLALFARAGLRRQDVDAALAAVQIHELPSARGCTYVLPESEYALGLAVGSGFGAMPEMRTAMKLGVTEAEIGSLRQAVLDSLAAGGLEPDEIRAAVGDATRSLGPEGAKKGISSTLPVALGFLQESGEIRRIPVNGRLDQQRYKYALWGLSPQADSRVFQDLARRFFGWTGPATMAEFIAFSGLGVKAAKAAVEPLGLVDFDGWLILPEEAEAFARFVAPRIPAYSLIGSIDNLIQLRSDYASILGPDDQHRAKGAKGHAIVDRGRVVGFWEFDPAAGNIVWMAFGKPDQALVDAVARTEAFIREDLGDARSFSLDSPKSRKPRIEALKEGKLA